jgi:hypothetical protein
VNDEENVLYIGPEISVEESYRITVELGLPSSQVFLRYGQCGSHEVILVHVKPKQLRPATEHHGFDTELGF